MNRRLYRPFLCTAVLIGTVVLSIGWAAQSGHEAHQADKPAAKGQPAMPEGCASMMKMRDEMMEKQKEANARLDRLLATMNDASSTAKVGAMAAAINELVKQRADAHKNMMSMEPAMKRHMMQHMMDAAPADMREKMKCCMDECPMMGGAAGKRVGDPYPLATCPITGKKLGAMGDPVVKDYDGQEVRFCCPGCPAKFEKDLATHLAKLNAEIAKDQGPLYPLKTSIVTGKELSAKPFEMVYGNRLIRLGSESEKSAFLADPQKHLHDLDKAVIAVQSKGYPLTKCPVSGEELGGDMGKPVDVVIAGRLIKLCCADCKKDIEKDPAKFIALIDAARSGEKPKTEKHE